jgi:hypothetical protein
MARKRLVAATYEEDPESEQRHAGDDEYSNSKVWFGHWFTP